MGNNTFIQKVLFISLLNTCYWCQFVEHKIKDCLLFNPWKKSPSKESTSRPTKAPKKDEWTNVVHKKKYVSS